MSSNNRRYRLISGIAYPNLYQGKNQPIKLSSTLSDPKKYYNDNALKLSDNDCKEYIGKDICLEHQTEIRVGTIADAWKDTDGHMRILARIYVDTTFGKGIWNQIERGELNGLSVGYSVPLNANRERIRKRHTEISLCKYPFFDGAEIKITANANQNYESINNNTAQVEEKNCQYFFQISMAENQPPQQQQQQQQQQQTAPSTSVPQTMEKKDGAEVMLQYDDMLKKMEEMKKQLDQKAVLENQLKAYQENENKRRAKYAEEQKPKLEEYLKTAKEQYGKDLPEEYVQSMQRAFMSPERESSTAVIVASQQAYRQQRDKTQELETTLNQLKEKMKKFEEQKPFYDAHVKHASERLALTTNTAPMTTTPVAEVTVNASGGKKFYDLFEPSEDERRLYEMQFGRPLDVNINASATGGSSAAAASREPAAPTHPYVNQLPYSMRNQDPVLYNFLANPSRDWATSGVVLSKNDTKVFEN